MASNSRFSRCAAGQDRERSRRSTGVSSPAPNVMAPCPAWRSPWMRFASAIMDSMPPNTTARSASSSSKAPAAARLSSTFLLTSRGLMRPAKSPSDAKDFWPRARTMAAVCPSPAPFTAESA